jgi:hypothetical protein
VSASALGSAEHEFLADKHCVEQTTNTLCPNRANLSNIHAPSVRTSACNCSEGEAIQGSW